jgi:hypothetical protein
MSKIDHGLILDPMDDGASGIDTRGRQNQACDIDIGGRNSQLTTSLIAVENVAGHGIGAAQEGAGCLEIAALDGLANPGAADWLTVGLNGRQSSYGESKFTAKFFEKGKVAATPMSEGKGGANAECLDVAEIANQMAHELFRGNPAERGIERDQPGDIDSDILKSTEPLWE